MGTPEFNSTGIRKHSRILNVYLYISDRRFAAVHGNADNIADFSNYYYSVKRTVPETSFNNMCGTLHDLSSVDGQIWKSHLKDIERVSNNHSRW